MPRVTAMERPTCLSIVLRMPPKQPRISKKDRARLAASRKKEIDAKKGDEDAIDEVEGGEGDEGDEDGGAAAATTETASVATSTSTAAASAATAGIPKAASTSKAGAGAGVDTRSAVDKAIDGVALTFAAPKALHKNTRGNCSMSRIPCTHPV